LLVGRVAVALFLSAGVGTPVSTIRTVSCAARPGPALRWNVAKAFVLACRIATHMSAFIAEAFRAAGDFFR
jgi:hypothetical protein